MTSLRHSPEKIRLPRGFSFSAVAAGIKVSGRPDLALVEASAGTTAAALFTSEPCRRRSRGSRPRVFACKQRPRARRNRELRKCQLRHRKSRNSSLRTSLPRSWQTVWNFLCRNLSFLDRHHRSSTSGRKDSREAAGVNRGERSASQRGALAFAHAIMTTDTRPKIASARFGTGSKEVTLFGIAKGAGMIHPQLATMLVYLFTDVDASST